jgi:hypothetical protein
MPHRSTAQIDAAIGQLWRWGATAIMDRGDFICTHITRSICKCCFASQWSHRVNITALDGPAIVAINYASVLVSVACVGWLGKHATFWGDNARCATTVCVRLKGSAGGYMAHVAGLCSNTLALACQSQ